jgi:asparagine N-glycosylation enzyme membrane subunit Stt3
MSYVKILQNSKLRSETALVDKHLIKKRFLLLIVVTVVLIAAALSYSLYPIPTSIESIGGKYNTVVTWWGDRVQLSYTDESGHHVSSYFDDNMKLGLNWINSSTPMNATFFCWWDYGHMIKAVGERNVIVRNPSHEILNSISDPNGIKEFDSNEKILDVASALTTDNQTKTTQIMEKYDATYLMVDKDDLVKSTWFFKIVGLNFTDYLVNQGSGFVFTDMGKTTMIARLLENTNTEPFSLVYQDEQMKIYNLK